MSAKFPVVGGADEPDVIHSGPGSLTGQYRRGSVTAGMETPRRGSMVRRGSIQLATGNEDLGIFGRNDDEAIAGTLNDTLRQLAIVTNEAMDKICNLQENETQGNQGNNGGPAAGAGRFEREAEEVFEAMLRNIDALVREMSETAKLQYSAHAKGQAKLLTSKLENSRKAAEITLKNKSAELSASFNAELRKKMAEISDGGGLLLIELQEKLEERDKQLADEKTKHDACMQRLKAAQESLSAREAQLVEQGKELSEHQAALALLKEGKQKVEAEIEAGRNELTEEMTDLRSKMDGLVRGNSSLAAMLKEALLARGVPAKPATLAEQISELFAYVDSLKNEVETSNKHFEADRMLFEEERTRFTASETAHLREIQKLKNQLSAGTDSAQAERIQQLEETLDSKTAEMEQLNAKFETVRKALNAMTDDLRDQKNRVDAKGSQLLDMMKEVGKKDAAIKELQKELLKQEEALRLARLQASGDTSHLDNRIKQLELSVAALTRDRDAATRDRDVATKDKATVTAEVRQLQAEISLAQSNLEKLLAEIGITKQTNKTLKDQLRELKTSIDYLSSAKKAAEAKLEEVHANAERDAARAQAQERNLSEQLTEANTRITEGEWWHGEALRVRGEIADVQRMLAEALSSADVKEKDKKRLGDQINELIKRYQAAESTLQDTSTELVSVTEALERSTKEANRRDEASRRERANVVRAALDSLQQLRAHLTFTLSGLRVAQLKGEQAAAPWKRSAGLVMPHGDPMIVQFVPPLHPLLDPSSKISKVPDYVYTHEDTLDLPPVQVTPVTPAAPTVAWYSDIPFDPLWPSNREGRPVELHRWGVSPRPPASRSSSARTRAHRVPSSRAPALTARPRTTTGERSHV